MKNRFLVGSSHDEYVYDGEDLYCGCKKLAHKRTSWFEANPSRRYHSCRNFKKVGGCRFFKWYDPIICERGKQLLKAFQESERKLAMENTNLRRQLSASMASNTIDEVVSSVQIGHETNFGFTGVEKENNHHYEYLNLNLKLEIERMKRKNMKLKLTASDDKKRKQTYRFLLFSLWLGFICVLMGMYFRFSGLMLALP